MEFKIIKKDIVTSTNDVLKKDAEKYESGTVLCAKEQTHGKGRSGRSFYSPPTGLYFSVLLKGEQINPSVLTVLAAVAVMKGIRETYGIKTQVKWVNDIFYDGRKVCGILTEGAFKKNKLRHAIVGIGINISTEIFPDEIKNIAGSLGENMNKNDELLIKILDNFSYEIQNFSDGKFLEFYKKNCLTLGRKVRLISADNSPVDGVAIDIGNNAELIVKTDSGEIKKIFYGEAQFI